MKMSQCANCGATNRIAGYSISKQVFCGRCHEPLPEPDAINWARFAKKHVYWIVLAVIIGGAVVIDKIQTTRDSGYRQSYSPQVPSRLTAEASPGYPPVSIMQGVQNVFTQAEQIAPLSIRTSAGEESYFVKVVDAYSQNSIITLFVHGGQTLKVNIPLGTYRIKYATGKTWYGEQHMFGPNTRYSEADKTFTFSVNGDQISGYTIELIKQVNGNLRTKSLSAGQF